MSNMGGGGGGGGGGGLKMSTFLKFYLHPWAGSWPEFRYGLPKIERNYLL